MTLNKTWQRVLIFVFLAILAAMIIYPVLSVFNLALKPKKEMYRDPAGLVKNPTWSNFATVARKIKLPRLYANSLFVLFAGTAGTILIGVLISFPLSRMYVRGGDKIYTLILFAMSLPGSIIPMYRMMSLLHLTNSLLGVSLYQIGIRIPMAVFILTGFISSVPEELDEAACIDGCSYYKYVFKVIFPLLRPACATVAIFTGLNIWNDFFSSFLYLTDPEKRTMISGLYMLRGEFSTAYNNFAAGLIFTLIPITVFYIAFQKKVTAGMTIGAVKG